MKKGVYIKVFLCLVVIAIIIIFVKGFNVGLEYAENTSITINIRQRIFY